MNISIPKTAAAAVAATLLIGLSAGASAQTNSAPPSKDELARLLTEVLPPVIGGDNSELVNILLKAKLGVPLSKSFDLARATQGVFGRTVPVFAPDCQRSGTPQGEPDAGDCVASRGDEGGAGAYTRLAFSKNLGVGNIRVLKRPAVQEQTPEDLKPVKLSDADAVLRARTFLAQTLGLPQEEMPVAPAGAKNPLPVRSLHIAFTADSKLPPVAIQKSVLIRRGFQISGLKDPASGQDVPWIPGPGRAIVNLDDSGVMGAAVMDWQELRFDPNLDPRLAKSRSELIAEIAEDLFNENDGRVVALSTMLVLSSDWRGSYGLLLPAVQVFVAPVRGDLSNEQVRALAGQATAGFVREYALVKRTDAQFPLRADK
ncbi:MAG: hypothetical protein KIT73_05350 [Burkholderiales bacterium]|nr:hypothetical protein [Burkholderiales bacterium]